VSFRVHKRVHNRICYSAHIVYAFWQQLKRHNLSNIIYYVRVQKGIVGFILMIKQSLEGSQFNKICERNFNKDCAILLI